MLIMLLTHIKRVYIYTIWATLCFISSTVYNGNFKTSITLRVLVLVLVQKYFKLITLIYTYIIILHDPWECHALCYLDLDHL